MADYKYFEVSENHDGSFSSYIKKRPISELPQNELLIRVKYSSLNYKDALSASGNKGVTKNYPHTPGIDAAGIVVSSTTSEFSEGDEVIVTSYDLGMNTPGGFAEYISVPANWAIKRPEGMSLREAMILGTTGLTAAMSLDKIRKNGTLNGKIAVSGASGGVGILALILLKHSNYQPIAISRKDHLKELLEEIGATEVISDFEINTRPMVKPIFGGAIDTVGGETLTQLLKCISPNGSVAACGMASSSSFQSTVFPFIIRGINLLGIDSAEAPHSWRKEIWNKLASDWKIRIPEKIVHEIGLSSLSESISQMLIGKHFGRTIINLDLD